MFSSSLSLLSSLLLLPLRFSSSSSAHYHALFIHSKKIKKSHTRSSLKPNSNYVSKREKIKQTSTDLFLFVSSSCYNNKAGWWALPYITNSTLKKIVFFCFVWKEGNVTRKVRFLENIFLRWYFLSVPTTAAGFGQQQAGQSPKS